MLLQVYWDEVKGNLYAVPPCALVGWLWLRAKNKALHEAHVTHNRKLDQILDHLDPQTQTDGLLDVIADRTDETTPGGIGAILARLPEKTKGAS